MDAYSDLDFFAIVEPDAKDAFISDLAWVERVHPIAFSFQNTRDGDKVLFTDGIYAEYAVLTLDQLPRLPIHGGRIVWQADGFRVDPVAMRYQPPASPEPHTVEWLIGYAPMACLTNHESRQRKLEAMTTLARSLVARFSWQVRRMRLHLRLCHAQAQRVILTELDYGDVVCRGAVE